MAGAEEPNGITGTKQEEEKREMKAGVIQQLPVSNLKGGKNASRGKTFLTQHGLEAFESGVPLETSASHQSSRLLEKQKQNASVQDELDRKRREVEQREEACRRKEEELKQKQNNAKKREERFNAFVQENEKRMAQAEKREKEDRQEAINKAAEIEKRKAELHELEQLRDSRRKQVERMSQYAAFLDEVVEASDTFSDVSELLQRYETLMKSNEDLHQRNASTSNELERTRSQFEQYTKEVQNDVLVKTSQIADMQKRLEKIRSDCMEYEERRRETKDIMNEHTRRYGLARMAIENLYTRARETSFLVKGSKKHGTLMEMLEYIEARILDLQYISNNLSYLQNIQSQSAAPTSTTIRRNTGQQQQEAARLRHLTGQHAVSSRA